jgi:O-antigen/teichoic acid export membrane protein
MKRKFLQDISANSLQVIINQLCGLVIFYVLSAWLSKDQFGEINWTLAVLLTTFNMLSFGIDQIAIKKIAAGNNINTTLSAYIFHVVFSGTILYLLLLSSTFLFKSFFPPHQLLLLIGAGKLMIFFSTPFKQVATGLEKFKPLVLMSICSNVLRSIALVAFAFAGSLDIKIIVLIFIAGDIAEFLLCLLITKYHLQIPVNLKWNKENYIALIKESMPQLGVTLFTSAMARLDWIFLGVLASNIVLANYSFAYKVFEVATVPLLILAPLLIPRFTRLFQKENEDTANENMSSLLVLLRLEIIIACLVALVLNMLWVPVIDFITHNKYGAVNSHTILILSLCMPFLYFNNFLWTISFAKGQLKKIFHIFFICFVVNVLGTVVLIIFFNGEGAAAAYLVAIMLQSVLFFKLCGWSKYSKAVFGMLLSLVCAAVAGITANLIFSNAWAILLFAIILYFSGLLLTLQLKRGDRQLFKELLHW